MIHTSLADVKNKRSARVVEGAAGNGLLVYSDDARNFTTKFAPFVNAEYGADMAQDASAGGTPQNVHDGEDNTYWTYTDIVGNTQSNSTSRASAGSRSIRWNSEAVGTISQVAKGSTVSAGDYVSTTFQLNINRRWDAGDSVALYAFNGGAQTGNEVFLEDYIDINLLDVWQDVTIPLSDLGIANADFDAFRLEQVARQATTPDFFIDEWQLQETGTPIEYSVSTTPGKVYYIDRLRFYAEAEVTATGVDPATFFGVSLGAGINYRRTRLGQTAFSVGFASMRDLLWTGFRTVDTVTNGTYTLFFLEAVLDETPLTLAPQQDILTMSISEDLSSFRFLQASAFGREEDL